MRTNIEIDDKLITKAQKLGNIKTKKAVVEKALELFIRFENQKKLAELWGKVEFFD
ncbi:MAG: type toxin-antitoxin system VapB family antitoxin [Sphingobacteriaceae bacterium]|jgi:Arc/MetJ family transcription regulator|nr:type toxin-antitoxin system VapB family antitoxin [Sphingobacteriaceae bacterium]